MECSIHATPAFDKYTGGIYHENIPAGSDLNHSIAVIGWGKDESTQIEYWIGRNSWGTYWGEGGFFRMIMDDDFADLGITTDCTAGTVGKMVTPTPEEPVQIIQ